MKKIFISSFLLVICHIAFSQHSSLAYEKLADSLYLHHHYPDAINYYEKALKNSNASGKITLQIAKSYVKINKVTEAYAWFEKAKLSHTSFSYNDTHEFIDVLKMLKKQEEAVQTVQELLDADPNDLYSKEILEDLLNFKKYYKDSLAYKVESLSFNTPASEFAPAYYKDGIVFSSAQPGQFGKKKNHWDNSDFLNLYFSKRIADQNFSKPTMFEKDLDTRYHDGPATFYAGFEKMIMNRNRSYKAKEKEDTWLWHLALYDGLHIENKDEDKDTWQLNALPFDEPPYSFAHPSISEDGTVLYFISDKPGGYGGTDIYKVIHANGVWGKPFNLGPTINTVENEVFPFFINNTLYFASNGHGGLGGLDIFKSTHTINGFTPPVNLAFPINSSADDFSFIIEPSLGTGYFSSTRNGNDDLFSFRKFTGMIDMVAHIYDGKTNLPLVGANVQITTASGNDIQLTTDNEGLVHFELMPETGYVIIANKDDKIGLLSGFVDANQKLLHMPITNQVPSYADTTRIPCIGMINDQLGQVQNNSSISITDETTGEVLGRIEKGSIVNFMGKKGHTYKIEVQNEKGDTAIHKLSIGEKAVGSKTWTMTLKKALVDMAVRVFKAEDNQPIGGATVKIITFSELDLEFMANENGIAEFALPSGTAYLAVSNRDSLTGMHSGLAEAGMDKNSIIHPIPMHGNVHHLLPVAAMIMNTKGEIIHHANASVVNKSTGEKQSVEIKDGLLTFLGEPGKDYVITIEHERYQTASEEVSIPAQAIEVEKISFALEENKPKEYTLAARVFKASDQTALGGAQIKVITFAEADLNLIADADGLVNFSLPDKTPYVVIGDKDGYTGMYAGVVEKGTDKESIVHPVAAHNDPANQLGIVGYILDKQGNMLKDAQIVVIDKLTGRQVSVQIQHGLLSFVGEKGKSYTVTIDHVDYQSISKEISVPAEPTSTEKITFTLEDKSTPSSSPYSMAARVFKVSDRLPLSGARVRIITFTEVDRELIADQAGIVSYSLPEGTPYVLIGDKAGYTGMYSSVVGKESDEAFNIHPIGAYGDPVNQLPIVAHVTDKHGKVLSDAKIIVVDTDTKQELPVQINNGIVSFMGEKGKNYTLTVDHKDYQSAAEQINIPVDAVDPKKIVFALEENQSTPSDSYAMAARIFKAEDNQPLTGAKVLVMTFNSGDKEFIANSEGIVDFTLPKGTVYAIMSYKDGLTGMFTGMASEGTDKTSIIHPIPSFGSSSNQIPVMGRITNGNGIMLDDAMVVVIGTDTGEKIPAQVRNGVLVFMGEKGKNYTVTVDHNNYQPISQQISVPTTSTEPEKITLALKEKNQKDSDFYTMAARVFKADDNQPLTGARVLIMTFNDGDKEFIANNDGVVDFAMRKGTVYAIMSYKDGFTGMFTGMAEEGTDKASVVHPIPSYGDSQNLVPIIGRVTNGNGIMLDDAMVVVIGTGGEKVPANLNKGVISFMGEKGKNYTVMIERKGYISKSEQVNIPLEVVDPKKITFSLEEKPSAASSNTILVMKDDKNAKYYISSNESLDEIIEKDSTLYLKHEQESRPLGKGSLTKLEADPNAMILSLGLSADQLVTMESIYFDYNQATLDETDKQQLDKAKDFLQRYPSLQLMIGAHADSRGDDRYNLALSKKRAKAIESYLTKHGIKSNRIVTKAYGERAPAVPCVEPGCSEEEYQKNRRAEFGIRSGNNADEVISEEPLTRTEIKKDETKPKSNEIFEEYGDKQVEGLIFKLSIGAYRHNHTLTFDELKDLGTVESNHMGGITYYFLGNFSTLNAAKNIQQQVVTRHVKNATVQDAVISFFYNGEKIPYSTFLSLIK